MASSPIFSARCPNASPPSVQWTRTRSPSTVFQSNRVSAYRTAIESLTVVEPSAA